MKQQTQLWMLLQKFLLMILMMTMLSQTLVLTMILYIQILKMYQMQILASFVSAIMELWFVQNWNVQIREMDVCLFIPKESAAQQVMIVNHNQQLQTAWRLSLIISLWNLRYQLWLKWNLTQKLTHLAQLNRIAPQLKTLTQQLKVMV